MLKPTLRQFNKQRKFSQILAGTAGIIILTSLVIFTSPSLIHIVTFTIVFFLTIVLFLSLFLSASYSLLVATTIVVPLFLKATDLLTLPNLSLLFVFILLLFWHLRSSSKKIANNDVKSAQP